MALRDELSGFAHCQIEVLEHFIPFVRLGTPLNTHGVPLR